MLAPEVGPDAIAQVWGGPGPQNLTDPDQNPQNEGNSRSSSEGRIENPKEP